LLSLGTSTALAVFAMVVAARSLEGEPSMPIYTCTIGEEALNTETKTALAREIGRIHSSINRVPTTYVNVAFHELSADSVYTDGVQSSPVLVSGWVRAGHDEAETTRLAVEIADAASRITGITADRVLVVIQSSPARFAVEGGRVLPEPWPRTGLDRRLGLIGTPDTKARKEKQSCPATSAK
jgi:phenylpyruvate tautomerase PptA (4-oxalocrotonate tautomerase family)